MQLFRTVLPTPARRHAGARVGRRAVRARVHDGQGPARGEARLSRLDARLARWFPPHEIVDRETPAIARTRALARPAISPAPAPTSAASRSTCAARRSRSASGTALTSDSGRRDHQLRRDRAGDWLAGRVARRRHRQRRQPGRDHRALPPGHRLERIADRLRRRPRPQDVADRPRTPLAHRAAGVAVLSTNHEDTKATKKHEDLLLRVLFVFFVSSWLRSLREKALQLAERLAAVADGGLASPASASVWPNGG